MPKKLSFVEIKQKLQDQNWKLLSKEYLGSQKPLSVICSNGHNTNITWNNFQRGQGCSLCFGNKKLDLVQVQNLFESSNCILLNQEYINNLQILDYICSCGNLSKITFRDFQQGVRCNNCKNKRISKSVSDYHSNKNDIIQYPIFSPEMFKKFNVPFTHVNNIRKLHKSLKNKNNATEDMFKIWLDNQDISATDIIIDYIKSDFNNCCPKAILVDVNLARSKYFYYNLFSEIKKSLFVFPHEWLDRKEQIINRYKTIFENQDFYKIGARKCSLLTINKEDTRNFCNKYHIQKSNNLSFVSFGLVYKNELIGILSLGRDHRGGNELILDRLCFKSGYHVAGGTERLLKEAISWAISKGYKEIISFSDNRYTNGLVYERLGFNKIKENPPDYSYVSASDSSLGWSKQSQKKTNVRCPLDMTENQWAEKRELKKVYDCCKIKWQIIFGS